MAVPSLHAQTHSALNGGGGGGGRQTALVGSRSYARGVGYRGAYRGGYYGGRGYGRFYYLGGVPYYYPFFGLGYGLGFGYPAYAYDGFWSGYPGYGGYGYGGYGYGYGGPGGPGPDGAYEGRVTDQGSPNGQQGASLPEAVQRQLSKRGYYKGTIDGNFGASSRSALSRFQRDNHLKDTGRIDEDTLEALGFSDHR